LVLPINASYPIPDSWKLRIGLVGNGTFGATPAVDIVSISLLAVPSSTDVTLLLILLAVTLVAMAIGLWRSPFFLILSALLLVIFAVVLDAELLVFQGTLARVGTLILLIAMSIMLFAQGALHLPDEFKKGEV
jgi:hypothetical protein